MEAKLVSDSLPPTIEDLVTSTTKMKAGKTKLLDYLNQINSFIEDAPNIDRKQFTQIVNDLDKAVGKYYDENDTKTDREYHNDIEKLAKSMGYTSVYEATDKNHADPLLRALNFFHVYGLYEVKRKIEAIEAVGKLTNKQKDFIAKYYPNINIWYKLACRTAEIKEILNPTKEQKQAKALQTIKGAVNPEIKKAIDEIAENFRKYIEQKEYDWMLSRVAYFKEQFPDGATDRDYHEKKNRYLFTNLSGFIKLENYRTYNVIPNFEEKARTRAINISNETIKAWQLKMYNKLGGFVTDLNKTFKTSVDGGSIGYNKIFFKFEDGSQFAIQNQIVGKVSPLGTYFYAYPTTFHNAFLPDGSKIANPNEYTVKKAFNDYR